MKVFLFVQLTTTLALISNNHYVYAQEPCCEDYCLGKDNDYRQQSKKFTSNSVYQFVRGNDLDIGFQVPNCTATKFWVTTRHGTRLPYRNIILNSPRLEELKAQILRNYLVLQTKPDTGALCMEDFLSIQSWKFNSSIKPDMAIHLATQGYEDLKYLARTYQQIFPDILVKEYDPKKYVFHNTQNQRNEESFKAFSEGLFGPDVYQEIDRYLVPDENDTLLRGYKGCPAWKENSRKTYNSNDNEYARFRQTALVKKTISDISRRLGFQDSLDFKDIALMWDTCRLEQAWFVNRSSIWCAAFTPAQLTVLEYYDDLRLYRSVGYEYELNSRVSCNLAKDMLVRLNKDGDPSAIVYISHSVTVETLIVALGMRRDSVRPTANNYEAMANRKWKTSEINPFSSNFAAVKLECSSENSNKTSEKAMFFLNQKRVEFDWCKQGLCDWQRVLQQYEHLYHANCTEYFCKATLPSSSHSGGEKLTTVGLGMSLFIFFILVLLK
ncbi:multiple inositol polyphosphate phosphatase 1-like [Eupeodes corollae]|uniref:multiple inositol polyphosphate phosphatase 1-like n=1 Tax=Eupeodes corollae TaxID=290404 RepID=UPI002490D3F2|nr:multiple inositol polyphosphate phosphatase 1-like [Eupeodes corollae]